MSHLAELTTIRTVSEPPAIAGLRFRGFAGEEDYPSMLAVIERSKEADQIERTDTLDDIRRNYAHLVNSDPQTDMLFAEVNGHVVGYSRVWWQFVDDGQRVYSHLSFLLPEWRGYGIRLAMLRFSERRLAEIARGHNSSLPAFYEAWASDGEHHLRQLLEAQGYCAVRYGFEMVRSSLDDIPDLDLPEGIDVRPARPEHFRQIWDAAREAFQDHWGYSEAEWAYSNLESWQQSPTFTPDLWQVAWAGDEVAGMVLNFISDAENQEYNRKRGYTETICVRRPWRRRGLARALIARSLRVHRDVGMTETALGVDAQNPNGALQLYESMGYQVVKRNSVYRKPLDAEALAQEETSNEDHSRTL